jgi:gliding motility-associated-like protein
MPEKFKNVLTLALPCLFLLVFGLRVGAQQCTLPSRIYLPTANEALQQEFGDVIDVDGDYMVATASTNSSLQIQSGIAFVFKLDLNHEWQEIAQLTPSDPAKSQNFGMKAVISGDNIVILAREFEDDGFSRAKLYFYEKPTSGDWVSATENYQTERALSTATSYNGIGAYNLIGDKLVMLATTNGVQKLEVFEKSSEVFTQTQVIDLPADQSGKISYARLDLAHDFVAIATDQYRHADGKYGAVFVFNLNGSSYNSTPAMLRASDQVKTDWSPFGSSVAVANSTIFVAGVRKVGNFYNQIFYVFDKPAGDWVDTTQPFMLEHAGYVLTDLEMVATDDYLFSSTGYYTSVAGFKKPASGWSSTAASFLIDDLPADTYLFGNQLAVTGDHLVVGCGGKSLKSGRLKEFVADYYIDGGVFDDPGLVCHQKIERIAIHATDDFFGEEFAVYQNYLAVTARGDDDFGGNTGAVYIFDKNSAATTPVQKIYAPELENSMGFGATLALGDSLMFIGAPFKDSLNTNGNPTLYSVGKVYVYRLTRSGWLFSSQIKAPVVRNEMNFGRKVTWSKGYVAITEYSSQTTERLGLVHIYKQSSSGFKFNYIATLRPSTRVRQDFFGSAIVMTDTMMVIGTGNGTNSSDDRLGTYVFKKKGEWKSSTEDAKLIASNGGWNDLFGASVSMHGEYIAVGAPNSPGYIFRPGPNDVVSGAVYIYKRPKGGWKGVLKETARLRPSDSKDYMLFGSSLVLDHDDLFIGAPDRYTRYNFTDNLTNNDGSLTPGKVYHFKKPAGGWVSSNQEYRQIQSFDPEVLDGYGTSIAMVDRNLYVGCMLDDTDAGFRTGSVQTIVQLPAITAVATSCIDGSPIKLEGFPKNGQWSGPGVNSTLATFNPTEAGAGAHVIAYNYGGCEASTAAEVVSDKFTINNQSLLAQNKCINQNLPIVFESAEPALNYRWYFSEFENTGYTKFDSLKRQISATRPGNYKVEVRRSYCPTYSKVFTISDEERVSISIDPVAIICDNTKQQLTASPSSGTWSGVGISLQGAFDPSTLNNGEYGASYKLTTALGCKWEKSTTVAIDKLLEPTLESSKLILCGNSPVNLVVKNVDQRTSVHWADENKLLKDETSLTLNVVRPGSYFATVSKHSCSLSTSSITVTSARDSLFVPNIITANGDAYNDYFEIHGEGLDKFNLRVFTKYGKLVYQTNDPGFKWHASDVSAGVYYWRATYSDCLQTIKEQKGWVHLIH